MHRRFRVSNFQSTTRVRPFCTSMPIGLSGGWNQIQFNLADFTRRAYGTNYVETTRMQIHANCRIRRIYFADRLYSEDKLPEEFKLYFPQHRKKCVRDVKKTEEKEKEEKPDFKVSEAVEQVVPEEPEIKHEAAESLVDVHDTVSRAEEEEDEGEEEEQEEEEEEEHNEEVNVVEDSGTIQEHTEYKDEEDVSDEGEEQNEGEEESSVEDLEYEAQ